MRCRRSPGSPGSSSRRRSLKAGDVAPAAAASVTPLGYAKALAVLVPAALLAGAFAFEYWGGLWPCEMCWWQRYAHIAALALAVLALFVRGRSLVVLAALAIAASGAIGFYHAGVERGRLDGGTQ